MKAENMRIYLDNCMFNRPFDDQSQIRIRLETEAKLYIQSMIKNKSLELIWSYILDFENAQNPHDERRKSVCMWRNLATVDIEETPELLEKAREFLAYGIKTKDALHLASAIEGDADYFLTTDDRLLSKARKNNMIEVINPVDYIKEL